MENRDFERLKPLQKTAIRKKTKKTCWPTSSTYTVVATPGVATEMAEEGLLARTAALRE